MKRFLPLLLLLTSCASLRYDHPSPLQKTREIEEKVVIFSWGEKKPEKKKKISSRKKLRNTLKWIKKNRRDFRPVAKPIKKKKKKKDEKRKE